MNAFVPRLGMREPFDVQIPLMSLARVFTVRPDLIGGAAGYLQVPADHPLSGQVARAAGRREIGLVWQGGVQHKGSAARNVSLEALFPMDAGAHGQPVVRKWQAICQRKRYGEFVAARAACTGSASATG